MHAWRSIAPTLVSLFAVCVPTLVMSQPVDYMKGLTAEQPMVVDKATGQIRLLATLQPKAFAKGWFTQLPGHHAVTWKEGKKGGEALLATYASDVMLYDAMISIGAKPGDNLSQAVWDERNNAKSKAPETRVEGSPVDVSVWWEGLTEPLPLGKLLKDPAGKGVDLRFGGQKALIPVWKSGCIICLQSCPGAKISNHAYTIRDYVEGHATFEVNTSLVPQGELPAVVIIRVHMQ
jgi:hypothetical protein